MSRGSIIPSKQSSTSKTSSSSRRNARSITASSKTVSREPWTPEPYQKRAVKFFVSNAVGGLFLDPGLGKTSITLAVAKLLREESIAPKVLVIAPLRPVYETWPEEIEKWEDFADTRYAILHGPKKAEALASDADVYLINPEGLQWLCVALRGKRWPFDILVIDESTKFKHTKTSRFRLLRSHLHKFGRRYILTGRPAPNGLMDLFGQIYVLDLGRALGEYITHYRNTFFDSTGYGGYTYVPQPGAEKKIYKAIAPYVLVMSQEEYGALPPLINVTRKVKLPKVAREQYDKMEESFFLLFEEGKVNAVNAAAKSGKLRQIANGGVYLDPNIPDELDTAYRKRGRESVEIHEAKTEELIDLLEELSGQPTLVAYEFTHELARLRVALKKAGFGDVPYIGGGVSTARFREVKAAWNDGLLPVLLAQPQSVAHGLNLQKTGRAVIWYGLTWDLEIYYQFIRRIWRRGVADRVFNYHIVAEGTIDEAMIATLGRKDRDERGMLAALKAYREKRRKGK